MKVTIVWIGFCEVSQIFISNWTWNFQLSILKNKKVLFLENFFFGRTAKIHPKDGVSRLNFPEGFENDHVINQASVTPYLKSHWGDKSKVF